MANTATTPPTDVSQDRTGQAPLVYECSAPRGHVWRVIPTDYYEILGVAREARQGVVKSAYRRLVKELHPDVNETPAAQARMAKVNVAYSTLCNPERRAAYDDWLEANAATEPTGGTGVGDQPFASGTRDGASDAAQAVTFLVCERCGRADETLTAAVFQYVVPMLILVRRGGRGGVFCERCLTALSIFYTLEVVLLGWLGGAIGVIWAIGALRHNIGGGEQPRDVNSALAWTLALLFYDWHAYDKALFAAERSQRYFPQAEKQAFIEHLRTLSGLGEYRRPRTFWSSPLLVNLGVLSAIGVGIALFILVASAATTPDTAAQPYEPSGTVRQRMPQIGIDDLRDAGPDSIADRRTSDGRPWIPETSQRSALMAEAEDLADEVEDLERDLKSLSSDIESLARRVRGIERNAELGMDVPQLEYERLIRQHNAKVDEYNSMRDEYLERIGRYNDIVGELR